MKCVLCSLRLRVEGIFGLEDKLLRKREGYGEN
jgi:hypothetical protein